MFIESLAVQGYRSLYEVEIRPKQLTVLTGPNNSGKTNFVEAVDFIVEANRHGLEVAVARKGGMENVAYRRVRRARRPMRFRIQATFDPREPNYFFLRNDDRLQERLSLFHVTHDFELSSSGQTLGTDFAIEDELLTVRATVDGRVRLVLEARRNRQDFSFKVSRMKLLQDLIDPFDEPGFREFIQETTQATDLLLKPARFNPLVRHFTDRIGASRLYQLVPLEGRTPGVPTPNAELERHGRNLPAMVQYLQRQSPDAWQSVLDSMRRILPDLTQVKTGFSPDRRLTLEFVEKGAGRPWSSEDVSDGTVQTLALLVALFDPRSPLLLIEEPENSVHPWVLRGFLDSCREARQKQVMITTHSPVLLSYLRPENISLVWRREGRTQIQELTRLDSSAADVWSRGESSLFELLDSGLIRQAVPPAERMKIGIIVEGQSEFHGLPPLLRRVGEASGHQILKPLFVPIIPDSSCEVIARECKSRVAQLAAKRCGLIVITLDREQRQTCVPALVSELESAITRMCVTSATVVIKDRLLENWLISDLDALVAQRARFALTAGFRGRVAPNKADNVDGLREIKSICQGDSYSKVKDATNIFRVMDPERAAANSRSFRRLLRVLEHPTYRDQSKSPSS